MGEAFSSGKAQTKFPSGQGLKLKRTQIRPHRNFDEGWCVRNCCSYYQRLSGDEPGIGVGMVVHLADRVFVIPLHLTG